MALVHIDNHLSAKEAVEVGAHGLVHTFMDRDIDKALLATLKTNKVFVVPTLLVLAAVSQAYIGTRLLNAASFKPMVTASIHNRMTAWQAPPEACGFEIRPHGAVASPAKLIDKQVDDFEANSLLSSIGYQWVETSDRMMGGQSSATVRWQEGGANNSKGKMYIEGTMDSGFAFPWSGAYLMMLEEDGQAGIHLSQFDTLYLQLRGTPGRYRMMLVAAANGRPSEQIFEVTNRWQEVEIALNIFLGVDPTQIFAFGISASLDNKRYSLLIDNLGVR